MLSKNIKHEYFKNVLLNSRQMYHMMKKFEVKTIGLAVTIWTVSLSCFDDKRYMHVDGVTSYAYCHYQTFWKNFTLKINFTNQRDFHNCVGKIWSSWLLKKSYQQSLTSSRKSLFEWRQRVGGKLIFFISQDTITIFFWCYMETS